MATFQFKHRCPHCGELESFVAASVVEISPVDLSRKSPPLWRREQSVSYGTPNKDTQIKMGSEGVCISRCPNCNIPIMMVLQSDTETIRLLAQNVHHNSHDRIRADVHVALTYPTIEPLEPHPAWPENIRDDFNEARKLLRENKRPAFILPQCRAVLDVVVRELGAPHGQNLKKQIDHLLSKGTITQALADWAHDLREDANALLHEGKQPGTREEVEEYVAFIELLLHVTYELPASIAAKKSNKPAP